MPWPEKSGFHGAYNKLLYTLFPPDTDFTVVPQYLKPAFSTSADYIVAFEILFENKPVFILELKKPANLRFISLRQAADVQIRERMRDLADQCPIPTLHAPDNIPKDPDMVNDTAPVQRWDCDVLDAKGEARLRAVVDSIMAACENIANA
ncbi:hypothetical protein L210DRAFT_962355 [Boletus edulis BED1]|uniref:Uncharacterized protein n=1 Tax=Boletus edulis BED1 TaxID=1328754 RepID=A0AAD4BS37_BOLED|nr:hypothetical protein L210DRAFT_962355 [Boletus edulis BED1]